MEVETVTVAERFQPLNYTQQKAFIAWVRAGYS
jgi:hypothetical protein